MKFTFQYDWVIDNDSLLTIINDYQADFDLDEFESLADCPEELMVTACDYYNYFDDISEEELETRKVINIS